MDDNFSAVFTVILGLIMLIAPFFGIYYVLKSIVQYQYWKHFRPMSPENKIILQQYFTYYNGLPPKQQRQFERRVELFIRSKEFVGKRGLEVTNEMRVLIAATAIQITFGFKYFQLPRFKTINLYPDVYKSPYTNKYHKGDINPGKKTISLTWNHFLEGFKNPNDGINLGYHELTHAMSLENRYTGNYAHSFIDKKVYNRWKTLAMVEMDKIAQTDDSLFRKYASVNLEEFLAVTVEVFFEKPNEFYHYHGSLFRLTCQLLNQYPKIKA